MIGEIPFGDSVRPPAISSDEKRFFQNVDNLMGFQVADIAKREVVKRIEAQSRLTEALAQQRRLAQRYVLLQEAERKALARASFSLNLLWRPAITKLVARRLTSHSQGAGSVSSKSFMSKIMWRSGVANAPKFIRWQSPQACTRIPEAGVAERSAAMIAAAPR